MNDFKWDFSEEYNEDDTRIFEELLGSSVAFYIYCPNVFYSHKSCPISAECRKARPKISKGEILVPDVLFSHLVGGRVENSSITVGEKCLDISDIPVSVDGHRYINAIGGAEKLGLCARIYATRFGIIGNEGDILKFDLAVKKNPHIIYAASHKVVMDNGTRTLTKEDFAAAKIKWRERLVGSEKINDLSNPDIKRKITAISKDCLEKWQSMNKGDGVVKLWGDTPPVESCELREQYGGVFALAKGYATYGSDFYKNPDLAADIRFAFKWMNENMYGDRELEGRGFRDMKAFNWWDWRVGCGEILTDALLITDELFTYEEKKKYLKVLEFVLDFWRVGDNQNFASGRMSLGPKTAVLLEDPVRMERAVKDYHIMLEIRRSGEGTHTDYSNFQHGFPYNFMYGLHNLDRVLKSASVLTGTALELSSTRYYDLYFIFLYMYEAAIYTSRAFCIFYGRGISGCEEDYAAKAVADVLPMIGNYGEEEDAVIKRFVKRSLCNEEIIAKVKARCPIVFIGLLEEILNDGSISAENDFERAHAWFTADRATQHRNGYAFALAMPSERHPSYECINNANLQGWYTGDGALYMYTKHAPNNFDGNNFISNPEIAHRIPGTTVDMRERKRASISIPHAFRPKSDKVGCMDIDNKYIVAGMDYECYNQEEDEVGEDRGYGGGKPKFISDLVAKKAYFMLDSECVCLGAGINATTASPVNTIVEHRALVKNTDGAFGSEKIFVDGEEYPNDAFYEKHGKALYVEIENTAGYFFPDKADICVRRYGLKSSVLYSDEYSAKGPMEENDTEKPFFEIRIEHGKNPENAAYAYAIYPYATGRALRRTVGNPEFKIISNTPMCQAVAKEKIGFLGMVFYEGCECAGVRVSAPSTVAVIEKDGELKIKIAEPTQKADTVTVEILRPLTLISADARFTVECAKTTKLTLDTSYSVGEGYEATFKI